MNRDEYREVYLRSDHWRQQRASALARAGNRCQVCNSPHQLDVHHRTYERLGREEPGDLTVLCRPCHDLFHTNANVVTAQPKKPPRRKKVAADNWSRLSKTEQKLLAEEIVKLLTDACAKGHTGGLNAQQLAGKTGRRNQVIGSCLVSLSRQKIVVRAKKKRWKLAGQGQATVTQAKAEAWVAELERRRGR